MQSEKDQKYWKDYTEFIQEVENLTNLSPAALLLRYEELIAELNDEEEDYFLEWKYELNLDRKFRK
ncbi:hypothetical protein [Aquimarina brevivitae]|uniref:Uncharacterized protein n=1 Tax=Aquimarina brevivitae TaxID=323412 RepID=A0A4Q7P118_9FLAO|nr:hypothetical protein [Aquimarina brevivitae]RZS93247.1 hypothetical protein EV197_1823 [Aquimarina brevivitae]